ncbi:error-prone DNA polymerase [Microbulbifer sp. A4B17]|uniref:error-prone DNA polymerase n=1 Tax=Microbulbifer sp. A4B17 TaxID=359370 RepID=UPI000D52CE9C|nr:error-prone DNA polymerase [Microbulbifer sp. A4B17]AWF82354.1 error-prone DNA polymerase [Microbulbifer sp. A4B17]
MRYAELFCQSNFSFLQGASHPQELVRTAYNLQYSGLAITDECSLSGAVRAYKELQNIKLTDEKNPDFKLIYGSYFHLHEGKEIVLLAPCKTAYSELCQLISKSRLRAEKGKYITYLSDLVEICKNLIAIWIPNSTELEIPEEIKDSFKRRLYIAINNHLHAEENLKHNKIIEFSKREGIPLVATNYVLMHCNSRKPLQDVLNANYHNCTLDDLGYRIEQNAERYLRSLDDIQSLNSKDAIGNTYSIANQCTFCLSELNYEYPSEVIPGGSNASNYLRDLVEKGRSVRWPQGPETRIDETIKKELSLISELQYEHYFLTIYDIVQFAQKNHILYQGRGSAANSVVCYCLFITEIDPHKIGLLFERFISRERNEPPDIDVDFEHERREEVIQYIYRKYGRERAGLAASKTTYRYKSAVRDIGKALGINTATIEHLIAERAWWDTLDSFPQQMQKVGIDPSSVTGKMFPQLLQQIYGFPRHLSQHVGGFVITEQPLHQLVPIENAAMEDRTLIQWDKEDIEDLKLMKVDVLALGMLTALRKSLNYIALYGPKWRLQDIPAEDPQVYEMMCRADTVGVFQIESRAQMSMLPRLQPRNFYELTIEIAIVRPGPIQGGMVHPYLKRKQGLETVRYPHNSLRPVLERTLGVPIFQEQVIQLSMVAAGFSGGEADELRRAMASWGKNGDLYKFRGKLVRGMQSNGYRESFAEQLFNQMKGFGSYGFPESHSASFALLAYFSAWIKYHHPAAFYCGLLNSQPMGFYAPAQLVYDAQRHGVKVLPIDVLYSYWNHSLEIQELSSPQERASSKNYCAKGKSVVNTPAVPLRENSTFSNKTPALRLGMRLIKGLKETTEKAILKLRADTKLLSLGQFQELLELNHEQLSCLTKANAFISLTRNRHNDNWTSIETDHSKPQTSFLPRNYIKDSSDIDYSSTGLTLGEHPVALLRRQKKFQKYTKAKDLTYCCDRERIEIIGLVTCRQRPGSASGVMFLTLEDETGCINVVIYEAYQTLYKAEIIHGGILIVHGELQISKEANNNSYKTTHVIARRISSISEKNYQKTRNFH